MSKPSTIGELKKSGYKIVSVKDEMRRNLIRKLKEKENIFPGIIGYEKTVIPELIHAVLAKHDFILLGLRGQAKTRILRSLITLLDDEIPVIKDAPLNDNPFAPISRVAIDIVDRLGDDTPIEWLRREERYGEKLATPDVTVADLIGDIDPIKAATQKLHYADERVMHFGVIPRSNRGIFAINELPDLQPRIQVSLFNILEEKDFQIRGFNVRIPLDILVVFSANPEDYTNRGSIITPLKDRIDSQILTHYPMTLEDGMKITEQEAWQKRDVDIPVPPYFREIIEQIAFQARASEFIDQKSGVSARLTISSLENLISTTERRAIVLNESHPFPRVCDLYYLVPAITGKVELVYEGEQQGVAQVARVLIGRAIKAVFKNYFPDPLSKKDMVVYQQILTWFAANRLDVSNDMPFEEYFNRLQRVPTLKEVAMKFLKVNESNKSALATAMEFVLEGLHQNSSLSKDVLETGSLYKDMMGAMLGKINWDKEE